MFEKLQKIIAEELSVDVNDVQLTTDILNDLDADSLDVVELVMAIEDTFDITVDDSDVEKLKTVQDILTYLEAQAA